MKKKVLSLFIGGFLLITLTGCSNVLTSKSSEEKTKGNCTPIECIKQIEPENTVEEINKIIGVDGELTDETYNKYYWELSEDSGIEVTYYSSENGKIVADIDNNILKNNNVDFSKYDELKSKVNDGITYSEFITYIGNEDGTIIEKSSLSTKYIWVASDGSHITGTFSNSTNKCTYIIGTIK